MYELVKQKSTGFRIIMGIIITVFISAILKMAFYQSPTTFNDEIIKSANEINSHAPIIIDSTTRFDGVSPLPGNVLQYNYTLLTIQQSQIDTQILRTSGRENMIELLKRNPKAEVFRNNKYTIKAKYVDKNGAFLTMINILPNEY